jgi:hypothetical protein
MYDDNIMFTNKTIMVALLTIAIASSLITAGGIVNSTFADIRKSTSQSYLSLPMTIGGHSENRGDDSSDDDGPPPAVLHKDRSISLMSHSDDSSDDDGPPPAVLRNDESHSALSDDSDWTTADNNTIPEKYMNGLSNCESSAAADGHLALVEIMDCFHRVF